MVKKLYLDGCSLTYGQGLPRKQSLGHMFASIGGYEVVDKSRPGKSNMAIAMDTYQNYQDADILILGFTFSSRFYIKYHDQNLDFFPGHHNQGFGLEPAELDHAQQEIYKFFYAVYGPPFCDNLSDMLVDGIVSFLKIKNKIVIPFSWEQRNTSNTVLYPFIKQKHRLEDGHLNFQGMKNLFDYLQNALNDE